MLTEAKDQRPQVQPAIISELVGSITDLRKGRVEPFDPNVAVESSKHSFELRWSTPQLVRKGLTDPESESYLKLVLRNDQVSQFTYASSFKQNRGNDKENIIRVEDIQRFEFFETADRNSGIEFWLYHEPKTEETRPLRTRVVVDVLNIYLHSYTGR